MSVSVPREIRRSKLPRFIVAGSFAAILGVSNSSCRLQEVKPTRNPASSPSLPIPSCAINIGDAQESLLFGSNLARFDKIYQDPACFQSLIQNSTFVEFYVTARFLAKSNHPQANNIAQKMIYEGKTNWEKGFGLIVYGSRIADKKANENNLLGIFRPFLNSSSQLLQFCAIVGLLRSNSETAELFLDEYARNNKDESAAKLARDLLMLKREAPKASYSYRLLFGWVHTETMQNAFFRYPNLIDALTDDFEKSSSPNYAVWEAGCSLGLFSESMRIALNLRTGKEPFHIISTDINPFALLYASRGRYPLDADDFLEGRITAEAYGKGDGYPKTEMDHFRQFAEQRGIDAKRVIPQYFESQPSENSPKRMFRAKRKAGELSFAFDNVASSSSTVSERSMDAVVYTNVHFYLGKEEKPVAIKKIFDRLKPSGKLFLVHLTPETIQGDYSELKGFEALFGKHLAVLPDKTIIYQKP
ncbi:MAG: hypothetical protein WC624_04300 [Candidatus Margulisiibacteriota bacterium]